MNENHRTNWYRVLVSVLLSYQIAMSVMAGGWPAIVGFTGVVLAVCSAWRPSRRLAIAGVTLGTFPFGALMWWTIVAPLSAIVCVIVSIGIADKDIPQGVTLAR